MSSDRREEADQTEARGGGSWPLYVVGVPTGRRRSPPHKRLLQMGHECTSSVACASAWSLCGDAMPCADQSLPEMACKPSLCSGVPPTDSPAQLRSCSLPISRPACRRYRLLPRGFACPNMLYSTRANQSLSWPPGSVELYCDAAPLFSSDTSLRCLGKQLSATEHEVGKL